MTSNRPYKWIRLRPRSYGILRGGNWPLCSICLRSYPIYLTQADFKPETASNYSLNDAESWEIIKLIQDFPRIINRAADNFEPSIIAKFAISLAQAFNKYYAHTRILDENPERDSRLALSYATAVVLKEALRLLGVEAPEKM